MFPKSRCVWHFEVAMVAEPFSEEFVGQDSRLGESIHAAYDCTVDKTVVDLFSQTILINKFLWEDFDWHAHVLMAFEWCSEVEVFGICTCVFCTLGADDTVPHEFDSGEVCCACCKFVWVVNEVASCCDAYSVGVFFLGSVVYDNSCIGNCAICWDAFDFILCKKSDGISALCVSKSLDKLPQFLCHCFCPYFLEEGIFGQFLMFGDGFLCDWMDHTIA